jgi:hypothetical protein
MRLRAVLKIKVQGAARCERSMLRRSLGLAGIDSSLLLLV